MGKKLTHYYSDRLPAGSWMTACGRDGEKIGGLIAYFFKGIEPKFRCKICNKKFEEEVKKDLTIL